MPFSLGNMRDRAWGEAGAVLYEPRARALPRMVTYSPLPQEGSALSCLPLGFPWLTVTFPSCPSQGSLPVAQPTSPHSREPCGTLHCWTSPAEVLGLVLSDTGAREEMSFWLQERQRLHREGKSDFHKNNFSPLGEKEAM